MELFNTTVYTKEQVLRFQRFNARLFKASAASTHVVYAVLFAMLLGGLIYSIAIRGWIFLAIIALGMVIFARRYYFLYIAPAKKFDESSFRDLRHEYVFQKSALVLTVNGTEQKYYYDKLLCAYETGENFYIYANRAQALIVDKAGFTQGNGAVELGKRLYEKLGAKHYALIKR